MTVKRKGRICACGQPMFIRAAQCRDCFTASFPPKKLCACGAQIRRRSLHCIVCTAKAKYRNPDRVPRRRAGQEGLTDFLMNQRHQIKDALARMERRIYGAREAMEIPNVSPIYQKREALVVIIRGSHGHHGGHKCGGHE